MATRRLCWGATVADDIYDLRPQLYYGGGWHDAPVRDNRSVTIVRGRSDEQSEPSSSTSVTLDNRSGTYNPANPMSPLYGLVGRNTPMRVLLGAEVVEDFEDDDFALPLIDQGELWLRTDETAHGGTWSFRSAPGLGDSGVSAVSVDVPLGATTMTVWYRVSSEAGFDQLFIIGDWGEAEQMVLLQTSGEVGWTQATYSVSNVGRVSFVYQKDIDTAGGEDAAWIDDLSFANVRFYGEVASWSPDRTGDFDPVTGRGDAWTTITGAGVLRRLRQGDTPVRSALWQTIPDMSPAYYWPMEEGTDSSTQFASGLVGGAPMRITKVGIMQAGTDDSLPGSAALVKTVPNAGWADLNAQVAEADISLGTSFTLGFWTRIVKQSEGDTAAIVSMLVDIRTTATTNDAWFFRVDYLPATNVHRYRAFMNGIVNGVSVEQPYTPDWKFVRIVVTRSGSNETWQIFSNETLVGSRTETFDPGTPWQVRVGAYTDDPTAFAVSFGHAMLWDSTPTPTGMLDAGAGYPGEAGADRVLRLAGDEATVFGGGSMPMGPQLVDTLVGHLGEIERTDAGMLHEPRGSTGIAYRTRASLYNQSPMLTLDWEQGRQIAGPFRPLLDNARTRNDVTVGRRNGSSARAVLETGPMSVLPPPDGVGRVDTQIQANPELDGQLADLASWYLHVGTLEDARWPQVTVDLDVSPELAAAAGRVDVGDLIRIINVPLDVSADDTIDLIALGSTENYAPRRHTIAFNCMPGSAYRVGVYDDAASRYDSAATTREGSGIDSTQTGIVFTIADGVFWTTRAGAFPFDIAVGGERMTVTAIAAPSGSTQSFTVIRSVNGVVKSHPIGVAVHVWSRGRWAL